MNKNILKIHNELIRTIFGFGGYDTNDFPCYINWEGPEYAISDRCRTFYGSFDDIMSALETVKSGAGYATVVRILSCREGIRVVLNEQSLDGTVNLSLSKILVTKVRTLTGLLDKPEVDFGTALHALIQRYKADQRALGYMIKTLSSSLYSGPDLDSVQEHLDKISKIVKKEKEIRQLHQALTEFFLAAVEGEK